jgi:hypothetical protein
LNSNTEFGQKILSDFFLMDPGADEPGVLPVSYRVAGQRFIIDSYIWEMLCSTGFCLTGKR